MALPGSISTLPETDPDPKHCLAGWIQDPDPRQNKMDWFYKANLICSAVPPDDALVIAQAASFLVLNSALD